MLLNQVSEFVEFLTDRDRPMEEVLSFLATRTLEPIECTGVIIAGVREDGYIEVTSKYGLATDFFQFHPLTGHLNERLPMTDSINRRETVWITTLPDWGSDYPALNGNNYSYSDKTFICWPIEKSGTPCASIGIFCKSEVNPDVELDAFLKTVSNSISMYYFRPKYHFSIFRKANRKKRLKHSENGDGQLTERQLVILRLMANGDTNVAIARALGYSESTIRQETMKIYSKLGCEGRESASRIYREKFAETTV